MKIAADWLDESGLQRLMAALEGAGFQTLAVGGCVRNALMGLAISDVDLATAALPDTVTKVAQQLGFRAVPTGIDHGTVTVITPQRAYEVTSFRRDIATDGRHRSEEHTSELQAHHDLVCRLLLEKKKKKKEWNTCQQNATDSKHMI